MLEGRISKAVVVNNEKTGGTVLMGVAEFFDNRVNFKVEYDWDTLDYKWFAGELREKLAMDLDIAVSHMDIDEARLFSMMKQYHEWNKK
jgi:hypothetical protein